MNIARIIVTLLMLFAASSLAVPAEAYKWAIRFHGALVDSSGDDARSDNGVVTEIDDGGVGVGAVVRF